MRSVRHDNQVRVMENAMPEQDKDFSPKRQEGFDLKKGLAAINSFHREISNIILEKKEQTIYEYMKDLSKAISHLIERLDIFPHHIIWEVISDQVPKSLKVVPQYVLLDVTRKAFRQAPVKTNPDSSYPKDKFFYATLNKEEFSSICRNYFNNKKLEKIFDIPIQPGYSYINIPILSANEEMPRSIITLFYRQDDSELVNDQDTANFLEHVTQQVGLAWDKFNDGMAEKIIRDIDFYLTALKGLGEDSPFVQLWKVSRALAHEVGVHMCAFFLVDEQKQKLELAANNINPEFSLAFSLKEPNNIIVGAFTNNETLNLFGREKLETIITPDRMKPFEKTIRKKTKQELYQQGKRVFTPFVLFEHALILPISSGGKTLGITTMFRAMRSHEQQPGIPSKKYFNSNPRPFSAFETRLLEKVQLYIFNILVSYDAAQKRMKDIQSIISQVVSPIHAMISSTGQSPKGSEYKFRENYAYLAGKLDDAHALSKIAIYYVKNFEVLLDIDTRKMQLKKETIPDLRGYLIDFAKLLTPVIRPKCISINVTGQTRSNIALEVDKELFDLVIFNIIDNAVKYSFDPEDRERLGLQAKPKSTADRENVLVTATEDDHSVTIMVSNYGIEIPENEKRQIFEKGFRSAQAPDRAKGTGIGLFVPKQIIEKHGGTIELEAHTPRYNTVFIIRLPKRMVGVK